MKLQVHVVLQTQDQIQVLLQSVEQKLEGTFEYSSGTAASNIFPTTAIYKHYLFDIVLYTHLNIKTAQSFTTGETVTGGTSGATATVQSLSTTESATITGATQANPCVVTCSGGHNF